MQLHSAFDIINFIPGSCLRERKDYRVNYQCLKRSKVFSFSVLCCAIALAMFAFLLCSCSSGQISVSSNSSSTEGASLAINDAGVESTFEVESPLGKMEYPEKWRSTVSAKQTDDRISFSMAKSNGEEAQLFSFVFDDDSAGKYLGDMNGKEVYIVDSPIQFDETWNDQDRETVLVMKDDINVIIQGLKEQGLVIP